MIGLQVFAYREVQRHSEAATSASSVRAQVSVLQQSGRLLVPLYLEFTATEGVTQAELQGIPRSQLMKAIGVDFIGLIADSRIDLDRDLDALTISSQDVSLPSGLTVGTEVAEIRTELTGLRATFDAGSQDSIEVNRVYQRLVDLLEQINARSAGVFDESAITHQLADIGAETAQFLNTLEYATKEFRAVTQASISSEDSSLTMAAMIATGGFQASLERLRDLLSPARQVEFDAIVSSEPFTEVAAAMPSDVVVASFRRLEELRAYGVTFLSQELEHADRIQADAEQSRHNAISVVLASVGVSLLLLGLVLFSILRPLRRLIRQSRQLGDGDLALAPVKPTGPTDIRVLMRTFNDMVTTLRAYDAQVRRLALGETQIDPSLPGPLGDTLRQSVTHLAAVTAKLHASESAANVQARTDSLTGLANRPAALERLAELSEQARRDGTRCAIVFLDLDGFKSINDTQGHGEGDRILGEIGTRLRHACPDQLVARIGGDEFIVLVDSITDDVEVITFARKLIRIVSAPCAGSSGQLFTISASAGVSIVDGTRSPLDCIAQADSAVYHAKETGRGRVELYDERLARDIEDRADMALTMRQGLANNEFSLRLQPIIDIATKEPVGAEALLRWNRPGIGEVGPSEFIPIAERTGVILDLDAWVLEQSVAVLRDWQNDPLTAGLRIAVNISGRYIVDGSLSPLLTLLCERAGVDPGMIDLEITETHLVADIARASTVVDDLRQQGVKVAIDDFGTGYSSMSYLHQLTVDALKIDGLFVAGMCENPLDLTIVELLLRLGDSLGLKVVAEGVDSDDKLTALLRLGCPMAQGFFIARPMLIADATVWLRQQVTLASLL